MRERRALTKADLVYTPLDPNAILYEFERADASSADGINAVIKFIVRTNDIGGDTKENSGIFILEYATSTSDRLWEIFGEESKEITKDDSRALEFKEIIGTLIEQKHLEEWNKRHKEIKARENQLKIFRTIYALSDASIIKAIPKLSADSFFILEQAQDILVTIAHNNKSSKNEIYQKSRKQVLIFSALRIFFRLQKAFKMEDVSSPYDLICHNDSKTAQILIENEKDIKLIIEGMKDDKDATGENQKNVSKSIEEDLKELFEKIEQDPVYKKNVTEELQENIDTFKKEHCSQVDGD